MGGGELKSDAKPVMPAPALINEILIALIKMKIICQLYFIWLGNIAAIILNPVVGQKITTHKRISLSSVVPSYFWQYQILWFMTSGLLVWISGLRYRKKKNRRRWYRRVGKAQFNPRYYP